jgi:hypothetical protein
LFPFILFSRNPKTFFKGGLGVIRFKVYLDNATLAKVDSLLHIVPFCEGPNKKPEGFAKQKQKT